MAAEQSPGRRSGSFLAGLDVIANGLPPWPEVITYEMTIPICYWTASRSAVVVFLRFSDNPVNGGIRPVAMEIPYHREAGEWVVKTSGAAGGSGFPFDPVTRLGFVADLDGRPIVYGSLIRQPSFVIWDPSRPEPLHARSRLNTSPGLTAAEPAGASLSRGG